MGLVDSLFDRFGLLCLGISFGVSQDMVYYVAHAGLRLKTLPSSSTFQVLELEAFPATHSFQWFLICLIDT